jgi:protein O-GlcNAc transferase
MRRLCFHNEPFLGKRHISLIYIFFILLFIVLTLRSLGSGPRIFDSLVSDRENGTSTSPWTDPGPDSSSPSSLELPGDYHHVEEQPPLCAQRLGLAYLEDLRHSRATYCSEQSKSQLTCFHSQTDKSGRIDSFCIGQGARLDEARTIFQTSCHLVEPWRIETNESSLPLEKFPAYWYETGPRIIIDRFVNLTVEDLELPSRNEPEKFTILLKREGAGNPWHSLMEIMALGMTLDVLQFSPVSTRRKGGRAFLIPDDAPNTQVVILDDEVDGPYFDLWRLFAKMPTVRLSELPAGADIGNIIIPLPGASNPVWQSDWEPNSCDHSELLQTFSRRVLSHFNISDFRKSSGNGEEDNKIIVTFIDRRGTRKLIDLDKHIAALNNRSAHAKIRLVDLAAMPFAEQIQTVRDTDVLAGVHGAGLTHGMWLKEHSVMVEILPEGFLHKGFRNLAGVMGHGYFSTHGIQPPEGASEWQTGDVALEEDRFSKLMDVAIKSIYNKGPYNFDVYK